MQLAETPFERRSGVGRDDARLDQTRAARAEIDRAVTGDAQAGIDSQDAHYGETPLTYKLTDSPGRNCVPAAGSVRTTVPSVPSCV